MKDQKFFVGVKINYNKLHHNHERTVLGPSEEPTGNFDWFIGPFNTQAGAEYMAGDGYNHPCCLTPNDADRFAATGSFAVIHELEEEARAA